MEPTHPGYKLDELAAAAGVGPRTVRYYVQRGLLPAPAFRGRDTTYDEGHLVRLKAIRQLQARFLPLDAIEADLARRTPADIERLAAGLEVAVPSVPGTVQVPSSPVESGAAWQRWLLAPGLELHVAARAAAEVQALAARLRQVAEAGDVGARHGASAYGNRENTDNDDNGGRP